MDEAKSGRSLPWFRVDNDMVDHPKVAALAAELADPLAGWYVVRLWAWTMRYAARGRLGDGARTALERACDWRGQPGALLAALVRTGWLDLTEGDDLEVHDWDEHQGAAVLKAEKDANRKKESRKRRADGARTALIRPRDGAGNGTGRDETRRNEEAEALPPPIPVAAFDIREPDMAVIESWPKEDFWKAAELTRRARGYPPQKWPNNIALSRWWTEARGLCDVTTLAKAFTRFADDPHWGSRSPPAPFAGFMTQWNNFLPSGPR